MRNQLIRTLLLAIPLAFGGLSARAATYANDFNSDPTADPNFSLRPTAVWRATGSHDGSGYVSLTDAINGQQGTIVLPDLDPGFTVSAFNFKMKVRIGGGSAQPADGLSVSFADAGDAVVAGGTLGEEGTATGLSVNLDIFENGNGDGPALDVKVDNVIVAHKRFAGIGTPGPLCCSVEVDGAGNPISLETGAGWADFEMNLSLGGTLTVKYKGLEIYKDIVTGYSVRAGRFVIGARTGGLNVNQWVDNITVTTDTADPPPRVTSASPAGNPGRDVRETAPVQFVIDYFNSFYDPAPGSIKLTLDGTDVTSDLNTLIVEDSFARVTTVTYTPSPQWAPGSRHEAVLTFEDNNSPAVATTARKVFTVTPVVAATAQGNTLFIEAEDFNYFDGFDAGLYHDFGSPEGSYNGALAKHDVDYHLNGSNGDSPVYRVLNPPNGISVPGTPDNLRAGVALTTDYKVGWNDAGDWFNFTRTFPNTTYKIYGRFASGGSATHASLSRVTSDPKVGPQTTAPLGTFDGDATGGWDTFCFIPLRDASGNEVIVRLNGESTLRVTCLPGNYDFNYMAFVPTFSPTLRPVVASVSPSVATGESLRDPLIRAVIADRDTAVDPTSIRLFLDGVELTPVTIIDTASGAEVEYKVPASSSLAAGSTHTAQVTFADNDAVPVTQTSSWTFSVGPIKGGSGTLFIEAEDFNYSDDGVTGGLHANFGDPDCSLRGKDAIKGIDYDEGNDNNDAPEYRPATGVEGAKQGTDGYQRGDRTITCSYIVGWNDPGDWYNYTRDFGPSARYNVYARFSSGGAAENAELARITSSASAPNQTKQVLGTFNSPPTGNWDIFHNVPLRDGAGALASIRLGGTTTLRLSQLPGNFDYNYLAFVLADEQLKLPSVTSVEPLANSTYARTPRVTAVIKDEDTAVVASSLKLTFDGVDVTALSTITDTASGAEISYQAPNSSLGTVHTVKVEWLDNQATPAPSSFTWSYTEGIYNAERNLFIESEDFNTANGEYLPSNGSTPFNAKGLYNTLGATPAVDYNDAGDGQEANNYRTEGVGNIPHVNMVVVNDAYVGGAGARPGFTTTPDYKIGWTGPESDWYNYTRNYGAGGTYNVYLRASHGDGAATIGGRLETVEDATIPAPQNVTKVGGFRAPATGGWDTFTFIPMKDDSGNLVSLPLSGVQTLRYTPEANAGDINYLMLVPILPSNRCPVANSSEVAGNNNTTTSFQLSASDPDGDLLNYIVTQQPAYGTLSVHPTTGAASYTPNTDWCGVDTFKFKVRDGACESSEAIVALTITGCNKCPTASASSVTVQENAFVDFQLQAADQDGDALQYTIVQPPAHGVAAVQTGTGAARYTPTPGYYGPDSLTFKVNDGKCDSATATVSITVSRRPNVPPSCDVKVSPEACVLTFAPQTESYVISLNGTDACIVLDASGSSDADNDALTYSWSEGGTPVGTGAMLPACLPVGCHTLTVTVSDGRDSCSATITVCVISPSEAVEQIVALVDNTTVVRKNKRPLIASLKAAGASFDRGNFNSAVNQLGAFQNKVRAQIRKDNPIEAQAFSDLVDKIVAAIDCAEEAQQP